MTRTFKLLGLALIAAQLGCVNTKYPTLQGGRFAVSRERTPLPKSEHVEALEDTSVLGRVLLRPYDRRLALKDQVSENPCAGTLADTVEPAPSPATFESTEPIDAREHRYYRIQLRRRVEKARTKAYDECCAKSACGVGYVRALVSGEGEIAEGTPTMPNGNADVALHDATSGKPIELTLKKRWPVSGFVAFAVEGDDAQGDPPPPPSVPNPEEIEIRTASDNPDYFGYCTLSECIGENEFIRRYFKRTGSRELMDFLRDRSNGQRLAGASVLLTGLVAIAAGVVSLVVPAKAASQSGTKNAIGGASVGGGGVLVVAGGAMLLNSYDERASPVNLLTRNQARRFAERYNRSLKDAR